MSAVSAPGACPWRSFTSVSISPKAATRCCRDGRGIDTKQCGLTMMHRVGPCRCEKTTYALPGPYGGGEVMVFAPYAKTSCPKVAVRPTQCGTPTRASSVKTSISGQPAGRARRQLDSAPREVIKASSARRDKRGYQSTPMGLGAGISALDQLPRRRGCLARRLAARALFCRK